MKKYIIIVSLVVGALAYGQIKVQSDISNSISKQNPFLDASNYSKGFKNNEGKGLYFPTTDLTKWEFKTDLVNPGNFSTYFDGMIVYNTGEGESTTEASKGGIRKNLTKGFYYFKNPNQVFPKGSVANGEWVRLIDSFSSLWENDTENKVVKLKALSDGTPRTDSGKGRNSVTIDNAGIMVAKAYRGYNGGSIFPDYVFQKYYTGTSTIKAEYDFKGLNQVEQFVKTNGHLPGYKSAKEVKEQGYIDIIETQLANVEKIEELYLHTIEQEKKIEELKTLVQQILNQ